MATKRKTKKKTTAKKTARRSRGLGSGPQDHADDAELFFEMAANAANKSTEREKSCRVRYRTLTTAHEQLADGRANYQSIHSTLAAGPKSLRTLFNKARAATKKADASFVKACVK